ncbi:MAG: phosphate/phosphite/phosphonate ABC transporter substrate-binding protein [Nitrospiraceae bacterium]|nr:phosphate/phosphite/phosphonate ABC transporter substrate-binding protein [Nitrospiraceae bacterium]
MRRLAAIILIIFSGAALLSCSNAGRGTQEAGKVYKVGFMICNSRQETLDRFTPLTAYLSKKLGIKMVAVPIDTIDFQKQAGDLDFMHANSLLYIILNRYFGARALTADIQGSMGYKSAGAIVTLKDSPIKSIKDLKGKTMVFGPMLAPTGYMEQYDLMLKGGIDPERDLAFYTIPPGTYKHEALIYGVLYGKYDAGAFPMLDYEKMIKDGRINPADFRIIATGQPIPYCTFAASQKVDDKLAEKFKEALLSITKDTTVSIDGEVVKVLKSAWLDGFHPVTDKDYDVVRDMAKRTNMPPYQKY